MVVAGTSSPEFTMSNMVYQGTVWGPSFWNVFVADASRVLRLLDFEEILYADDLNTFKGFPSSTPNLRILSELADAQSKLHSWGRANQISFDPSKESIHILSRTNPYGDAFTILGITFDCKLLMNQTIHDCVLACGWKLDSVLRCRRFFCDMDLVLFFKSHIVSFIKYRICGIFHTAL